MAYFLDGAPLPVSGAEVIPTADGVSVPGRGAALGRRIAGKLHIAYRGETFVLDDRPPTRGAVSATASGEVRAPMPGTIVEVAAAEGARVEKGTRLVVIEAMKTQQPLVAPFNGEVESVAATVGASVAEGDLLVRVRAETPDA